ncbi:hypothetical protein EXIGLDRAFT_724161 [Exidia glandulosa HHB12029]|uniref:BHLH domain-containing protein n=1 Tax=Exidia glandulosa HHB12029 TaxID=1314781 RepID=A0A165EIK4_EXIGL|nr:hypothetical protein EXIGLDRAFT_724161 [Exidia glandulosa HHB12029]
MILKKSVEYIRYLQQLVTAQANRNSELEAQLSQFRGPGSAHGPDDGAMAQLLLASPGVMATMYEETVARGGTESDEDMGRPGTSGGMLVEEEERGRGRNVTRLGGGTQVKTETTDVSMDS